MNKNKKTFIFTLVIFIVLVALISFFLYPLRKIGKIETKENISDLSQLPSCIQVPDSSRNVSYCKIFGLYTGYEFDISEEVFLKWAQKWKWPVEKITEPTTFMTFRRHTLPKPDSNDPAALEEYESKVYLMLRNGYYFYKENKNQNGGGIEIAYDKDKQRAYYSFSFR